MNEDQELEDMLHWLNEIREASDEDFQVQARPFFDNTIEMRSLWNMEGREAVTDHITRHYKGKHRA